MQLFASYGPDILHFLSSLQSAFSSAGVNCIAKKIFVSFSWDPCNISTCTIKINHLCRSVKYTIPVDAMGFGSPSDMSLWHVDSWHTGGAQIPLTDGLIGVSGWSAQGPTRPGSDLKTPHCKFVKKMEVKSIFSDVFCHASENPIHDFGMAFDIFLGEVRTKSHKDQKYNVEKCPALAMRI